MLDKIQTKFKIQGSVVRTTTDNGANFVSSFKLFGQQTIQVLDEHHPEEDAIREELRVDVPAGSAGHVRTQC